MDTETADVIVAISTAVMAFTTIVIGYFSYVSMEASKKVAWFTGAMESHSQLQLMLEAKHRGSDVKMLWWDPTLQVVPSRPKHGEPVELSTIYLYLPPELRAASEKIKR